MILICLMKLLSVFVEFVDFYNKFCEIGFVIMCGDLKIVVINSYSSLKF